MSKSQNMLKLMEEVVSLDQQNELITNNIGMVKTIVNSMAQTLPAHVDRNDLYSAGREGLVKAARTFDPTKGAQFKTYAEQKIRWAVGDELRGQDPASRSMRGNIKDYERIIRKLSHELGRKPEDEEVAKAMGMSIDDYYDFLDKNVAAFPDSEGEPTHDIFDILGTGISKDAIKKAIDSLPEDEKKVITLFYLQDWQANEIADEMGKTEGRISQIHSSAMFKLKRKFGVKEEESITLANKILAIV